MIDRTLEFNVKGNRYQIEFPNVGMFQNIETMKQVLSKGMYGALMSTGTITASKALDMVDIEAHLSILVKADESGKNKLLKDLKCSTFSELGLEDYLELEQAYKSQFEPWWNNILELLNPKKKQE